MLNNTDLDDKRDQKRFEVKEGVFAVFITNPPKLAKIKEISKSGLTVRYFDNYEGSNDSFELDILLSDSGFRLRKVPYQTISNFEIAIELSDSLLAMKQQGFKFKELTPIQKSLLDYIIYNHTLDNHAINRRIYKERRQSDSSQSPHNSSDRRIGVDRRIMFLET